MKIQEFQAMPRQEVLKQLRIKATKRRLVRAKTERVTEAKMYRHGTDGGVSSVNIKVG